MEQNEELKKDEVSPIVKTYIESKKKEKENANQNPSMEGVSEETKLYIESLNKK